MVDFIDYIDVRDVRDEIEEVAQEIVLPNDASADNLKQFGDS